MFPHMLENAGPSFAFLVPIQPPAGGIGACGVHVIGVFATFPIPIGNGHIAPNRIGKGIGIGDVSKSGMGIVGAHRISDWDWDWG